ncbi:S8/S53 family peptidase [Paracoccus xiamenensis]|uniref:hypothetical protein n=1 Tax=Paracoccus xiamenensis TaxID=2714901 RepID=UPI0014097DD0|nr:hypothetical protein [Paracoccus xiamenensis]NHF72026.1 hypothetical protein [Paracoccus xiamenensis]
MDMPPPEARARRLPHYTGPYERWIFSAALGRPFAFPAISDGPDRYYGALTEGALVPARMGAAPPNALRLPPLWNPQDEALAAVPFAVHRNGATLPEVDGEGPAPGIELTLSGPSATTEGMRPRYRVSYPVADQSWVADYDLHHPPEGWVAPATPPKVIVGIIDDGIPFAHRAFLDGAGRSRISHCWLQSAAAPNRRAAVPFGREFTNAEIDSLRAQYPDETQLYREAGGIDAGLPDLGLHLRGRASHGAHIAGICAGNDPRVSGPVSGDDIQIIAVQLPNTVAWDTSGFGKETYMLSALHYILNRARQIAAQYPDGPAELPLIVNFSYGWSANRHDGGATMERAFQQLLTRRKAIQPATALNMPMGNNFEKRMHAQITRADLDNDRQSLGWWLSPDDMTSSYLEIWFPKGFDPRGSRITVQPPLGCALDEAATITLRRDAGESGGGDPRRFADVRMGGDVIGQLSADKHFNERWRVLLALIPTGYAQGAMRRAPAGEWRLGLKLPGLRQAEAVHVWLQRDDDPGVLRSGGRQSHLVALEPDANGGAEQTEDGQGGRGRLGMVRGFGTFNGISSSAAVTRVAGYDLSTRLPSRYSGAGGLRQVADRLQPWGVGPAFAAPADQGQFRPGLPSIGILSGSGVRLQGTSAAAACATRWMADNVAKGRALTEGLDPLQMPSDPEEMDSRTAKRAARLGAGWVRW